MFALNLVSKLHQLVHHFMLFGKTLLVIKGLVHPKMKILSVITHAHVVSTP